MSFSLSRQYADSEEPCIRYKALLHLIGRAPDSREIAIVRDEVRDSVLARTLLAEVGKDGRIPLDPYEKWRGAHWVLSILADLGYPAADQRLAPLRDQVYDWLFGDKHQNDIRKRTKKGRSYWHASQEGNALYYMLQLGWADERSDRLAASLLEWQWPDGGWNCDLKASGETSSFTETLWPLRGLALHARLSGSEDSARAVRRAAEVFLRRNLYRRERDGQVIKAQFTALHYPCYWHYDVLFGLRVLAEAGFIGDERCRPALDLLKSKQIEEDGGFAAEGKYFRVGRMDKGNDSLVDWGGTNKKKSNPYVSVDALGVLKAADYRLW